MKCWPMSQMGHKRTNRRGPKSTFVRCCRWSQLIDATLYLNGKDGVFGDVARISSRFHCGRENGVVGALAAGGVAESDWAGVWQAVIFHLLPGGTARGIRPAPRRRSRLALTLPEREEISRGIAAHQSARSMARLLGRSPSTVSRELSRNGGYDGYRAALADEKAWVRSHRPKRCKLAINPWLRQAVASKLRLNWAPEQIAGWLKRAHPDGGFYRVSHETIYRSLFVQARGVLKKELLGHLRSKRTIRRSGRADPNGDGRGQIKDLVSISQRPAAVEDRAVPGHWEGDLLSGSKNSYIATLVERYTRYVMLSKVANKDTQTVVSALIKQAKTLPNELYKSLTWDRGKELTDHRRFTLATNIDVYFCDPQSPVSYTHLRAHETRHD